MLKNAIKTVIIINQVSPNLTLLSQYEVETSLTLALVGHLVISKRCPDVSDRGQSALTSYVDSH